MMRAHSTLVLSLALLTGPALAADRGGDRFADYWHDGRAEIDAYDLTLSRYDHDRTGQAVLIYVTEPFSRRDLVKADRPGSGDDTFEALKLNLIRDFQTGIYDYNTMSSVFVDSADMVPVKTSFSSAEWCGHVYEEMFFAGPRVRGSVHSYFQGESSAVDLAAQPDGIPEEALFILLRGLDRPFLAPGEKRRVKVVPAAITRRLQHHPAAWVEAVIERAAEPEPVTVAAGSFATWRYQVELGDGRSGTFWVEAVYPHRIVRWRLPPDLNADLKGSQRLVYWQLSGPGDERALERLGLAPGAPIATAQATTATRP